MVQSGGEALPFEIPHASCSPAVSRSPPSNLALASESPDSLRVSWTPPSSHVLHYRLSYALASGSGPEKSVGLPGAGEAIAPHGPPHPGLGETCPILPVEGATLLRCDPQTGNQDAQTSGDAQVTIFTPPPPRSPFQDPGAT